jgi:hypothetical protein
VVDGNALNLLNHDVRSFLTNEGMLLPNGQLVRGYSKVSGALDALQQFTASGSLGVKQAQVLRKTFARAAKSQDGSEAAIGSAMVKQLDDFFENLPVQAFSTNGKAGMDAVKHWAQAREDWARFKKTDQIEKAIKNASYSRDGFAEGLRAQFASILKSEKKSLSFWPRSWPPWTSTPMAGRSRISSRTSAKAALFLPASSVVLLQAPSPARLLRSVGPESASWPARP